MGSTAKRILTLLLSLVLVFTMCQTVSSATDYKAESKSYAYSLIKAKPVYGNEWLAIDLARDGYTGANSYLTDYYESLAKEVKSKKGVLSSRTYTEYSKAVIVAAALGRDPKNVGGYNLVKYVEDYDSVIKQGVNGPIWALIALDSRGYASSTREKYIQYILDNQKENGSWNNDTDYTAMALQALAGHPEAEEACEKGINFVEVNKTSQGSYRENDSLDASAETTAQVIIAKCALGIEPDMNGLYYFYKSGGKFEHYKGKGVNALATEQAYRAEVAYARYKAGKTGLFDMSDVSGVTVNKPGKGKITYKKSLKKKQIKVKWSKVTGAKGYQLAYRLKGKSWKSKTVNSRTKVVKGLKSKKTYYVKVRAFKYINGSKKYGSWSAVKKVKVK